MQRGSLIQKQAGRAGVATWLGFLLGSGVKLVLAFAMVGIFMAISEILNSKNSIESAK
jgi:uncharacterized protein YqgC (DUF456 family)